MQSYQLCLKPQPLIPVNLYRPKYKRGVKKKMPTYSFRNTETGEEYDEFMTDSKVDKAEKSCSVSIILSAKSWRIVLFVVYLFDTVLS